VASDAIISSAGKRNFSSSASIATLSAKSEKGDHFEHLIGVCHAGFSLNILTIILE